MVFKYKFTMEVKQLYDDINSLDTCLLQLYSITPYSNEPDFLKLTIKNSEKIHKLDLETKIDASRIDARVIPLELYNVLIEKIVRHKISHDELTEYLKMNKENTNRNASLAELGWLEVFNIQYSMILDSISLLENRLFEDDLISKKQIVYKKTKSKAFKYNLSSINLSDDQIRKLYNALTGKFVTESTSIDSFMNVFSVFGRITGSWKEEKPIKWILMNTKNGYTNKKALLEMFDLLNKANLFGFGADVSLFEFIRSNFVDKNNQPIKCTASNKPKKNDYSFYRLDLEEIINTL